MRTKNIDYNWNARFSIKSSNFPKPAPIEKMRFYDSGNEEHPVYTYVSDVSLLCNSERIVNTLGLDTYRAMITGMALHPKSPYDASSGLTDEQLLSHVKSRYIQSPSEMRAWMQALMAEQDSIVAEAKARKIAAEASAAEAIPETPKSE